jgi:hypothetical protein
VPGAPSIKLPLLLLNFIKLLSSSEVPLNLKLAIASNICLMVKNNQFKKFIYTIEKPDVFITPLFKICIESCDKQEYDSA